MFGVRNWLTRIHVHQFVGFQHLLGTVLADLRGHRVPPRGFYAAKHHPPRPRTRNLVGDRHPREHEVVVQRRSFDSGMSEANRSWSCACPHGYRRCVRDTTVPARSPSETAESARRVGPCRGGPGRCRPPVLARGRSGEPLFAPLGAALVRRTSQTGPRVRPLAGPRTGSTRHGSAVAHWP